MRGRGRLGHAVVTVTMYDTFGISLPRMSHTHAQPVTRILGVCGNFSENEQELRGFVFGL